MMAKKTLSPRDWSKIWDKAIREAAEKHVRGRCKEQADGQEEAQ